MESFFRFRDFPVYKEIRQFRKELKQLSKEKLPKEETYVLRPQLWRALDSSILNIAEGSDRSSDKDFSHFLNISLTSINEVVACLDCIFDDNYISLLEHQYFLDKAENIIRQLKAFLSKVRKDNHYY
jgi:four helix bundle protein